MVTVCLITYNQEKWIRQAIESVLSQQTDYQFEVIIGEDHGIDGTRAICEQYAKRYPNVSLLPSPRNYGVAANWINCIQAGTGKYIMTCAGDDYWHNPKKIQLQVDFMEKHPECVLSYTDIDQFYENTQTLVRNAIESKGIKPHQGYIHDDVIHGQISISALTSCIRRESFEKYIPIEDFKTRDFPCEDWPTWVILSAHGEFLYQPVSTGTYRMGQESITRTSNYDTILKRAKQSAEMTKFLYSLFPEWGEYSEEEYFANKGIHNALIAAYRNNDYESAKKFAKDDKTKSWAKRMVKTKLTFHFFRWLQFMRNKF